MTEADQPQPRFPHITMPQDAEYPHEPGYAASKHGSPTLVVDNARWECGVIEQRIAQEDPLSAIMFRVEADRAITALEEDHWDTGYDRWLGTWVASSYDPDADTDYR